MPDERCGDFFMKTIGVRREGKSHNCDVTIVRDCHGHLVVHYAEWVNERLVRLKRSVKNTPGVYGRLQQLLRGEYVFVR